VRLFIALEIPTHVRRRLAREQQRLAAQDLPFRWVRADAMHLTLAFLGETPETRLPDVQAAIDEASEAASSLTLHADGTGTFPPRGTPHVVWAGLGGDRAGLSALYASLTRALSARGVAHAERAFSPHITLGRLGPRVPPDVHERVRQVDTYCEAHRDFGRWTAEHIHLIHSELRADGARYTTLYTSALKGNR
jgi:RNA 2',3'-cyclic 3'-phosphodiesterase